MGLDAPILKREWQRRERLFAPVHCLKNIRLRQGNSFTNCLADRRAGEGADSPGASPAFVGLPKAGSCCRVYAAANFRDVAALSFLR